MKYIKLWTVVGILSISMASALSYTSTSKASNNLQSKGKFVYNNETNTEEEIILDANDHVLLKNNIDTNSTEILSLKEFAANQQNTNEKIEEDLTELLDLWKDENGMSLHDKLDYIIANGSGGSGGSSLANAEIVLLGTGNNFNISDIVGEENVGKYSINDFIVCDDLTNAITTEVITTNVIRVTGIRPTISLANDFQVIYDNTTGNVEIINKTIKNSVFYKGLNAAGVENQYFTIDFNLDIPPKVYLCVKSGNSAPTNNGDYKLIWENPEPTTKHYRFLDLDLSNYSEVIIGTTWFMDYEAYGTDPLNPYNYCEERIKVGEKGIISMVNENKSNYMQIPVNVSTTGITLDATYLADIYGNSGNYTNQYGHMLYVWAK